MSANNETITTSGSGKRFSLNFNTSTLAWLVQIGVLIWWAATMTYKVDDLQSRVQDSVEIKAQLFYMTKEVQTMNAQICELQKSITMHFVDGSRK